MYLDDEIKSGPKDVFSKKTAFLGPPDGGGYILYRKRIFLTNVNVPLVGADRREPKGAGELGDRRTREEREGQVWCLAYTG